MCNDRGSAPSPDTVHPRYTSSRIPPPDTLSPPEGTWYLKCPITGGALVRGVPASGPGEGGFCIWSQVSVDNPSGQTLPG